MSEEGPPSRRTRASRVLTDLDRYASRPLVAVLVLGGDLAWVLFSVTVAFPTRLETVFQTLVAAITLAMVFVIQHTQARQQAATQRKLDEILLALPDADNSLLSLEQGTDHELRSAGQSHRAVRNAALHDRKSSQ